MSYSFVDKMMESIRTGELKSPVEQLVGMKLVEFGRGQTTYELAVRPEHSNPIGIVQGGVATVLADAAMAMAMATTLTNDEIRREAITTVDLFSRFMRPISARKVSVLRADAHVIRTGRHIIWAECGVSADGDCIGRFNATGSRVPFDQKDHAFASSTTSTA
jgi:uncharacterized protein (TIGR00369 family)